MSSPRTSAPAWEAFLVRQCAGTVLAGTVSAIVPFGAFVKLDQEPDGVVGLLHRSEWAAEPVVGSTVTVRILEVDPANRRVSLAQA